MTTTLGIKTKEGIVIAADRRVSAGESFIASKKGKKIHVIDKRIGVSIAGLVSDAQDIIDRLNAELKLYNYSRGHKMRIEAAAQFIAKVFHSNYRARAPIMTQLLIAGTDDGAFHLYEMDPSGALLPDDFISTGSGSPISYGVLEGGYREDLTLKDAEKLAYKAIAAAIERNPQTGNGIDIAIITNDGFKLLTEKEVTELNGGRT
ncbi:MAG: proteasome subunit beta [Candidatus Helarchaeota archaeon]